MGEMSTNPAIPIPNRVYIVFTAEIVPQTTEALIQALSNLAQKNVPEVYLAFATPGGNVMHGMTLYNFLRGAPFKLITHNIGNVDSIGNAVFLAGVERYACKHSTFMFHGVGFDRPAGRLEEKALREMLDGIGNDQHRIGGIIAERSSIAQEEIEGLFREAQTKNAEFARERGIVHDIREFQLPAGQPVISFVFQR
jgi:ATP-dependent protease ClpP protease subunit